MTEEKDVMGAAEGLAYGAMHLFWGNTLSTVILAVCAIAVGRLLGPANYGLYSLAIFVPTFLLGFIDFGITSAIMRFSAKFRAEGKDSDARKIVWTGILFELALGITLSLFCFALSYPISSFLINRPTASFYIRVMSFLILFLTFNNVLETAFIGLDRTKFTSLMMIVQAIAKIALSLSLILIGLSVLGALLGQLLSYVIVVPVGLASLSLIVFKGHDDFGWSSDSLKTMLKYGMPLYLGGLASMFLGQYQTLVLAHFVNNTEIGNFQVAVLFESSTALIGYPFITLFPAFSKLKVESGQVSRFFRRSVKYVSVLLLPVIVAIAILSKDLIYTLFGSAYVLAPTFLTFYVLIDLYCGFGSTVFSYLFMGIGRTDVALKVNLIGLLVFLPLAPLLTFLFGVLGLILSLFIINFCQLLYFLAMTQKYVKTGPDFRTSAKAFAATALSAVPLIAFLRASPFSSIPNLILGAIIILIAYLTLLPILGVLNQEDMEIFKQLFRKIRAVRVIVKLFISYETKILGYKQKLRNQN